MWEGGKSGRKGECERVIGGRGILRWCENYHDEAPYMVQYLPCLY